MNGAEVLMRTAANAGLDTCFANPGTTEMPLVNALDTTPDMRAILGLFEGVCTGAADGYGRMAGKPALTLLHLGPGLANGIANLHNARRARTPLVNLIGEHATWHLANDPPLAADIAGLAHTVSGWVRTVRATASISQDIADAIVAARQRQVATLIVPNDLMLADVEERLATCPPVASTPPDMDATMAAARLLRADAHCALILGGNGLTRPGLEAAARVQAATGCALFTEGNAAYVDCGTGTVNPPRVQYFPEHALPQLAPYAAFVLVDTGRPVAFFGYPDTPGTFIGESQLVTHVGGDGQDVVAVLEALADALGAPAAVAGPTVAPPVAAKGALTPETIGATLAACQPEGAIVVNEGVTTGRAYPAFAAGAPPFTMLNITGGSIGFGLPAATGAAAACPGRPVIDLQADGSALYTIQALWTQAREGLDVTTLVCANRRYHILDVELQRAGIDAPGPAMQSLVDLGRPDINWVELGQGLGVPGVAVETAEELAAAIMRALAEPGPHLIEARIG